SLMVSRFECSFCLLDLHLVIAGIQCHQYIACFDELVVGDKHFRYGSRDAAADTADMAVNICIIGLFPTKRINPPTSADNGGNHTHNRQTHENGMALRRGRGAFCWDSVCWCFLQWQRVLLLIGTNHSCPSC